MRNKSGNLTTDFNKIIIRKQDEKLYTNKLDNRKMDKSFEIHNLPKLTHEIENLNRPITSKEIEY